MAVLDPRDSRIAPLPSQLPRPLSADTLSGVGSGLNLLGCGIASVGLDLQWTGDPNRWIVPQGEVHKLQIVNKLYLGDDQGPSYPLICDPSKQTFCFDFRNDKPIGIQYVLDRQSEIPFLLIYDSGSEVAIGANVLTVPTIPYHVSSVYAYIHAAYSGGNPFWSAEVASGFANAWKWAAAGNFSNPKAPSWQGTITFSAAGKPVLQQGPPVRVTITFFTSGLEIVSL